MQEYDELNSLVMMFDNDFGLFKHFQQISYVIY